MSHFTQVKTVIRDREILCDALRKRHYDFQEGENLTIRGYQGNREKGQVVVKTGSEYDIGFQQQQDSSYACCADWWGVQNNTAIKEDTFLKEVNRTYQDISVRRQIREQGLIIEEEHVDENGEITLVVCEPY